MRHYTLVSRFRLVPVCGIQTLVVVVAAVVARVNPQLELQENGLELKGAQKRASRCFVSRSD